MANVTICSVKGCNVTANFIESTDFFTCSRHHMERHYPDMVDEFYGDNKIKNKKKYKDLIPSS